MNINNISVSRKGIWDECKQKYKYRYHLKLESPEPEPFYFVYGKIIHKIAENFVKHQGDKLISEVAIDVLEGKIPIEEKDEVEVFAPSLPRKYALRFPEHLKSIKKITEQIGYDGYIEYPFNYDLDPPNEVFVKGFIDRLIQKNGEWFIIDYKTTQRGVWRKNSNSIVNDLQLRMYARVVQKEFNVPADKIRCALYYLEGSDLIAAQYSQEGLEDAEKQLIDAFKEIKNKSPESVIGTVGDHCPRCVYKTLCPFYRN